MASLSSCRSSRNFGLLMNACVCIVGWYFQRELLEALQSISGLQLFVISHQPRKVVPEWVLHTQSDNHLFFERNIGYDWGAYQQFISKEIWKNFETIFFMHDDVTLFDSSVFPICDDTIHSHAGNCVIGNGRNTTKRDWPLTHIYCYAHSVWKPPSWDFEHDTVRGSFFAVSRSALAQIKSFEILWDRRRFYGVGAGNYSLRATCGRIQYVLGEGSFLFLNETYRHSSYLIEQERGQEYTPRLNRSSNRIVIFTILVKLSKKLMTLYMNADPVRQRRLAGIMQTLFRVI